jgi:hypothetical protein
MHDMREILLMAKSDEPPARNSVEDIVAAGRRRRRRAVAQRLGGAGAVAAAVATAAVLVAVNLAVPGGHGSAFSVLPAASPPGPSTPAPSPPFTFTFAGYQVDDYRVLAPDEVSPAYQSAGVLHDKKDATGKAAVEYAGTLTVYQPKMFNPEQFRTGTKLTIQGRDAFQADVQRPVYSQWTNDVSGPKISRDGYTTVSATSLAWQYAPDAWAVLQSEGATFPAADQLKVAERFTIAPGDPVPARIPFRTGYLPAGFTLQYVSGQSMNAENRGMVTFVYSKPPAATGPLTGAHSPEHDGGATSVVISILWVDVPPPDAVKRTSRCNDGQHWCMTNLPGGEFWFAVEDPSKTLSDAELLKIADGLTFATIKDDATWYPVS